MTYRFVTDSSLRVVQLAFLIEAIVRGLNYITTPDDYSLLYWQAQESMPLDMWGSIFVLFGVTGLFGEWLMHGNGSTNKWDNKAWPSFIAHIGLMVLFVGFSVSAMAGVTMRDGFYGFVVPYDLLIFAVVHWAFARRRRHV